MVDTFNTAVLIEIWGLTIWRHSIHLDSLCPKGLILILWNRPKTGQMWHRRVKSWVRRLIRDQPRFMSAAHLAKSHCPVLSDGLGILKDICTTTVYGAATYRSKGQICCKAAVFAKFQCNVDSAAAVKDFHRFLSISDSVIFLIAGLGMDFLTRVPDFPIWFLAFLGRPLEHSSPHDQSDQQPQH